MLKIAFLLALLTVIHHVKAAPTSIDIVNDDKIKFVDAPDETDTIREKIRSEMDEYKRLKELALKKKAVKSVDKEIELTIKAATTTTAAPISSSTLVQIFIPNPDDEVEEEEEAEMTTLKSEMTTIDVGDRHILSAPLKCKDGERKVGNHCRVILRSD